jgi:hypothetical protein
VSIPQTRMSAAVGRPAIANGLPGEGASKPRAASRAVPSPSLSFRPECSAGLRRFA